MPVTFFAHQTVVLPLKKRWPTWFDGTALVIGSMAPDFGYPIRGWVQRHSHQLSGMIVWGLPFTIVVTLALRSWVANTAFAQLPDAGPFRLHSYRVLRHRYTPWWKLVTSSVIGVGSHILVDSFTHKQSFMSRWLGLDRTLFHAPWDSGVSIARTLQYLGHTLGSAACVAMLLVIGRRRLMEQWCGREAVVAARRFKLRPRQRQLFWAITAAGLPLGPAMAYFVRGSVVTKTFMTTAATTAFACSLAACQPRDRGLTYFDALAGEPTPAAPSRPGPRPMPDVVELLRLDPLEPTRSPRASEPRKSPGTTEPGRTPSQRPDTMPPPPKRTRRFRDRRATANPVPPPGVPERRKQPGWYD